VGVLAEAARQAKRRYENAAAELSAARRKAAAQLEAAVAAELPALKLDRARFFAEIETDPDHPSDSGIDRVAFTVETNPGSRPGPLAKPPVEP
jgi:DNA repair protein RecN (Recombination protein N)